MMGSVKVAVRLESLGLPLRASLEQVARLGAEGVELDGRSEFFRAPGGVSDSARRQLLKWLDDYGLKVAAVSFVTRRGYDAWEELDQRVAATKRAMSEAYALGARILTNTIGRIAWISNESGEAEDAFRISEPLREVLLDLGRHGDRCGVKLAARTVGESPSTWSRLLAGLPEGALTLDFDPAALILDGYAESSDWVPLLPDVWHVRGRDVARDRGRGGGMEVMLGRGSVEYPWLFAQLAQHAFAGYVTVERGGPTRPWSELSDAIAFLHSF